MKFRIKNILNFFYSENYFLKSTYLMAFTFALTPFLSSMTLIVFSVFGLFHFQNLSKLNLRDLFILSFIFFLYFTSLLFTPSLDRALKLTIRISPVFLIPAEIYFTQLYLKVNYSTLKKYFIVGVVISCIISIIVGLINCTINMDLQYLFYYELGYFFHTHPTYYAFFVIVSFHFTINHQGPIIKKNRKWILTLFFVFIFLLQSKIALIVLSSYLGFRLIKLKNKKKALNVLFAVLFLSIILFFVGSKLNFNRFNELIKPRTSVEIGNKNEDGISQRIWLWTEAQRQLKEKPIFGYGLGSQKSIFKWKVEKYTLENEVPYTYSRAVKRLSNLNLHNQYIQTFYEFGIVGGLFFLLSIVFVFYKAAKGRNYDFLVIYLFFLVFMFSENLLERQMGIYFYGFMLSLFYYQKKH